ncbi:unnamed protein product, partial [Aphanomyces euteiches]
MEVLLNPHLLGSISQFQTGIYSDLVGFPALDFDQSTCVAYKSTPNLLFHHFVLDFAAKFTPWFQGRSVRDIHRLVECQNHLEIAIVAYAVSYGNMEILRSFQDKIHNHPFLLELAASNGHGNVVMYLIDHNYKTCSVFALDTAARNGHLDVIQLLHHRLKAPCTTDAMDKAAANGHLKIVQFLATHRREGCTHWAIDMAARHGHLDVVQYLHSIRALCTINAMNHAA